ncbi:hypothetical protein AB0I95_14810 [Micromonospora sp. NPDC049751]|uniref:hypothetical protein n=1 Tax=Micromonospora sp. NPDC049751 TaxID=3154837 RepID=UPI0033DB58B6
MSDFSPREVAEELILDFGDTVTVLTVQERSKARGVRWLDVKHFIETATVMVSWDE